MLGFDLQFRKSIRQCNALLRIAVQACVSVSACRFKYVIQREARMDWIVCSEDETYTYICAKTHGMVNPQPRVSWYFLFWREIVCDRLYCSAPFE